MTSQSESGAAKRKAGPSAWDIGVVFMVGSVLVFALSRSYTDPDLWGHLRFGLDNLAARSIAQVDPYSYVTAGQRWINHEWLAEVLLALAWRAGGSVGMILLKVAVGLVTFFLLARRLYRLGIPLVRLACILLLANLFLLSGYFPLLRPQIYTFLLFAVTLLLICRAEEGAYRWLWAAAPVFAAWANLHGGFLAGLGVLVIWALVHVALHPRAWKKVLPPVLAAVVATLANPYGYHLWPFLLRTATVKRPEITEWQPLELVSASGIYYALVLCLAAAGWIWTKRPRQPALLVSYVVSALLPWTAVRHLALFSVATLALAGEHIASAWERLLPTRPDARPPSPWLSLPSFAVGLALLAVAGVIHLAGITTGKGGLDYPAGAVQLLKQAGAPGNLAVHFDWGEYTLWHLGPRIKVSVDGRRETVYPEAAYDANLWFMYGVKDWAALLRDYPTDAALVKPTSATRNLLELTPGWRLVYEDAVSALFVRADSAMAAPLEAAAQGYVAPEVKSVFP